MSTQKTVLVVDDEELLREAIAFQVKRNGFNVVEASNMKEALEAVTKFKIDLVISDIRMPHGDGVMLLEKIKAMDVNYPVVVLMTGFADYSEADLRKRGAVAVLQKPLNLELLDCAINTALKKAA